ncbi:MAG: hypothetical protein ABI233_03325 [Chthoniobacterales bacterium]
MSIAASPALRPFAAHLHRDANYIRGIPGRLLDRMQMVQLAGYTDGEKLEIARKHLVRRQLEENGLTSKQVIARSAALRARTAPDDNCVCVVTGQIGEVMKESVQAA